MTRRGFTLVEVMVVVVVASLIGLGVAGTVSVALDTRERVEARRLGVRSALAWRALVTEALRNARPAAAPEDTALLVIDGTGPDGAPEDRLVLLTAGTLPPLHPGTDWVVSLERVGDRVRLMAAPVGVRSAPVRVQAPAAITGLEVMVLSRDDDEWLSAWSAAERLPRAVRIRFWTRSGPDAIPLTVGLPELGERP